MATPELLASRLRTAMAAAGMTQHDLAARIGMAEPMLSKAMNGRRNFKPFELALIAQELGLRVDDLLAPEGEPDPTRVAARAQHSMNLPVQRAVDRVDELVEIHRLLADLGYPAAAMPPGPPTVDPALPSYEQGELLAERLREHVGLGLNDLPATLHGFADFCEDQLGIGVALEDLDKGWDGLSISRGPLRLALVSTRISPTRQRFTLAHEIGHITGDQSEDLVIDENVFSRGVRSPVETRANAFAAAFLMPHAALERALTGQTVDEALVAELLRRFGVSQDALAYRLHNCALISAATRNRIQSMSPGRIIMRSGRTSDLQTRGASRQPGNLLTRAMAAYTEGAISVRPLAALLGEQEDFLLDVLTPPMIPGSVMEDADVPTL